MVGIVDKQKLSRFTGDGSNDPACHRRTCITIWQENGENDQDEWMKEFPATLEGIAIDWYMKLDVAKKATQRRDLRITFEEEFKLLRDDDEIVT